MGIPVVIVDNAETDRYIARRRFSRTDGFGECVEYPSGIDFLKDFPSWKGQQSEDSKTIVLMDISMPGKNGFQTVNEFLSQSKGIQESNVIFVMYTSSNAAVDREQAASIQDVGGYVQKPLNAQDVLHIRELAG